MACQYGVTLALLLFVLFCLLRRHAPRTCSRRRNANAEHKRGMGHADSLLQSLLIQAPVVTPYTASSPYSIVATRRFLHDTTLSCLPLDADSDAVALHDGNLTEELSHAAAIC